MATNDTFGVKWRSPIGCSYMYVCMCLCVFVFECHSYSKLFVQHACKANINPIQATVPAKRATPNETGSASSPPRWRSPCQSLLRGRAIKATTCIVCLRLCACVCMCVCVPTCRCAWACVCMCVCVLGFKLTEGFINSCSSTAHAVCTDH